MARLVSSLPILRSFAEILTWRLSTTGTRWLEDWVARNSPANRLHGVAIGIPYSGDVPQPDAGWDVAKYGLALLVFVNRKQAEAELTPDRVLKSRSADAEDRYVTVPTDGGFAQIAVDIMSVEAMTAAVTGAPRPGARGDGWRIEGDGAHFGTVAAFFSGEDAPAGQPAAARPGRATSPALSGPDLRVLTAAHVVAAGDAPLAVGGQWDAGRVLASRFSVTARDRWPDLFAGQDRRPLDGIEWKVDAAILSLTPHAQAALFGGAKPAATPEFRPPPPEPLERHLGRRVEMSGQTTGLQFGRIYGIAFEWVVPELPRQLGDLLIGAEGSARVPASEPGDSGKGVVDRESRRTIGLVWDGFYRRLSGFPADSWAFATASDFAMALLSVDT